MEKSIYRYLLRYSLKQQVLLTFLAAASFPFLYAFYEVPKEIVNGAIEPKFRTFPVEFLGFEFDQVDYLFLLCAVFLLLMTINQAFKYVINVYGGITGERMLRRLRYDLYSRTLRFPLAQFRKTSAGEIITMITAEVEPLGGFVGDAIKLPVFQGGYLLVILTFLLVQNWIMAVAAIALYPLQFYLIPKLQRKVNSFGKERVRLVRRLSDRIGESVAGVQEIRTHDTAALERAVFSHRLDAIYRIRRDIFVWKFIIKFVNNSINQLGPFFFYSIGGYLVIKGSLEIGTLIAAIGAHKDLAAPWKELLNYYQQREDARIKFGQVVEQFAPPGLEEEPTEKDEAPQAEHLTGEIAATNLRREDETGTVLVDGATFAFPLTHHVAVVGDGGSGKDELARLIARLSPLSAGSITIGGVRLSDVPVATLGSRMAYVAPGAYLFATSVRDNLFYGLKHRPMTPIKYDAAGETERRRFIDEAERSGNSTDDIAADWMDYAAGGVDDAETLTDRALDIIAMVDLDRDIYDLGLRGVLNVRSHADVAEGLLEARRSFRARLEELGLAATVETFDENKYNNNATLGENLLFGTPVGGDFDPDHLAENPYVLRTLEQVGLEDRMLDMGREVAATMVELFADLPPGHEFFEQFSFISDEELPDYQVLLARIGREGIDSLQGEERRMLLSLPFKLSAARHRLGVIDDEVRAKIVEARRVFARDLPPMLTTAVEFFDAEKYNAAATVQDNILFGKLAYGQAQAAERVSRLIGEVVESLGLRKMVMEIGLAYEVGVAGARMSAAQRQKLAIARAVLKRPDVLILNEAAANLDSGTQARLKERLRAEMKGRGLLWVFSRTALADGFDQVLVMRGGKVVEQGSFEALNAEGTALRALLESE